jgi:RimJ/RimL family protein N-acetyltransferase
MTENLFRGKLVRLAAGHPDDYEVMARWWDDSEFQRLMDSDPAMPMSAEELKKSDEERPGRPNSFGRRIRTIKEDRLIGFINLFHIEWNNGVGGLGVGVGERDFWGRGYGSEAVDLVLHYAFNELNLHRVWLGVFDYNTRADQGLREARGQARRRVSGVAVT